ncbi:MAG: RNA polymerase sigma factor [Novosphingobium sp.]|nr:RNA polymerase sigma factor [Novosphingobium sp.]
MSSPTSEPLSLVSRRLRPALIAFFRRRGAHAAEAEDLSQDVFERLARARAAKVERIDQYIFQIAVNLLRDRARRENVRQAYSSAWAAMDEADVDMVDPYRIVAGRQQLERIAGLVEDLPDKTRDIYILHRFENFDKAAIANSFGLSVRMVEIHLKRALTMIFERMDNG